MGGGLGVSEFFSTINFNFFKRKIFLIFLFFYFFLLRGGGRGEGGGGGLQFVIFFLQTNQI